MLGDEIQELVSIYTNDENENEYAVLGVNDDNDMMGVVFPFGETLPLQPYQFHVNRNKSAELVTMSLYDVISDDTMFKIRPSLRWQDIERKLAVSYSQEMTVLFEMSCDDDEKYIGQAYYYEGIEKSEIPAAIREIRKDVSDDDRYGFYLACMIGNIQVKDIELLEKKSMLITECPLVQGIYVPDKESEDITLAVWMM